MRLSHSSGSLPHKPCHWYPIGDDYSSPGLGTCTLRVGLCVRFSIRDRPSRSPKTLTPPVPVPSCVAAPRQPIRRLSLRPLLLGVSSTAWAYGLDACSIPLRAERATDGLLYAVSHVSGDYYPQHDLVAEWRQVPFWACLSASLAGFSLRRFRHTFVA